jgi:RNA polymerase sigma factor (sigma-70 family)
MAVTLPPFQVLIDEHRDDVYRFLRASVGPHDADDCFQETFIAALRAYPRLRGDSNLRGWLFTIANRKALDSHRARGRRATPVAELPEAVGEPLGRSPIIEAEGRSPSHLNGGEPELWQAVGDLPTKQRASVLLRFAGDLAYREIGEATGCSEEAARRNVHEGLKKLREVWVA